jgi:4-amino-4-deoxy-L-arabinose transferase-like glycosyltransferase
LADCLAHVALAAVTVVAWFGLGSLLLTALKSGDTRLDALNRIGAGAIAFALLTFGAGWAGVLHSIVYLAVFAPAAAVGVALGVPFLRRARFPRIRTWRRWQLAVLALLGVYVALAVLSTCAPISSPDALLYHAADPALFENAGRIVEVPWNSSSYEPFTVEILVLDGFLLWDSVQGAFAPLLLALVALAAVVGFAERLAGRSAALLAGAIFFAQPFMLWESTSVFIEPGLACAVALSAWNLARFVRHSEQNALVLAGLFAGGAAGMKYLGLIAVLAIAGVGVIVAWQRLNVRSALAFSLPAVAVALPWYVKNAVLTGNPFYPHIFGGLNAYASAELDRAMKSFGHGHAPLDFILLPVRLLVDAEPFDGGEFLSPLFLVFAPLVFLGTRDRRTAAAVWIGVLLYGTAWFATTQQARFLVPLMPVLAVLAALGALGLAQRGRLGRLVTTGAVGISLVVGLGASAVYAAQFAPVAAGTESREEFLKQKVSLYEGIKWLNRSLGPDEKVATTAWALLYLDVPYTTFGTMADLLPPDAGAAATRSFVLENGVSHVAVLAGDSERLRQMAYLDARLVARVPVKSIRSRTRGEIAFRQDMLIWAIRVGA